MQGGWSRQLVHNGDDHRLKGKEQFTVTGGGRKNCNGGKVGNPLKP